MQTKKLPQLKQPSLKALMAKLLFFILIIMLVTHVVVFVTFTSAHKSDESRVNRGMMAQQVLHVIQLVATTPPAKRASVVEKIDVSNIDIDIGKLPEYKATFKKVSMWYIIRYVSSQRKQIRLSLALGDDQWLNIDAQIVPKSWYLQVALLVIELLLACSVLFYLWSINRFVEPLKRVALAAKRLGQDLNSPPLCESGPLEVKKAMRAMNNMQDKLRDLILERTKMLAAISHDLRTPITRLRLRSQFIQDEDIRDKNIHDLDEMALMINDTLDFAKEDTYRAKRVKLEFGSLLTSLCDDLNIVHLALELEEIKQKILVYGRPVSLRRAFTNIIENAVKYGQSAKINAALNVLQQCVVVKVEDEGGGIPEAQFEKVFSPFFRSEASRSRETGGTGLGLAVARDIIRAHGGDITLKNIKPSGLCVVVTLPIGPLS